ncbi:MAG: DDE-type integrase/transposase/recombinase [Sulfitobacter sp.]
MFFYVLFAVSYRDLEEIMAERGVDLDHATRNRWVEKSGGAIAEEAHLRKAPTGRSWRMDGACANVKGQWPCLLPRDRQGKRTVDFMLSEQRDEALATVFSVKSIGNNGWPDKVIITKKPNELCGTVQCKLPACGVRLVLVDHGPAKPKCWRSGNSFTLAQSRRTLRRGVKYKQGLAVDLVVIDQLCGLG